MRPNRSINIILALLVTAGVAISAQGLKQRPAGLGDSVTFEFSGSTESFFTPAGVTLLLVEAWAGGGGGGTSIAGFSGGGGGGGGYARSLLSVSPGSEMKITIGGGGLAGPIGTGAFGYDPGRNGSDGGGGGGGSTLVFVPGGVLEACGGGGGGHNVGGFGQGSLPGGGRGGGSLVCYAEGGGGGSGSLGTFDQQQGGGSVFRGGQGGFFVAGFGANGGNFRGVSSGGLGQSGERLPENGGPGLVRITYY